MKTDPNDTAAIDAFAAEQVREICRAGFRDIAENMRPSLEAQGKSVDVERFVEQMQPDPEFVRQRLAEFKETIRQAMQAVGKIK